MKERASPALIGAFILGALALVIAGVFFFAGSGVFAQRQQYVMYFEGSVYGLQVGAPVVFRGVRIGNVKSINLRFDDRTRNFLIPVVVETVNDEVDGDGTTRTIQLHDIGEFIDRGLRARLATQSLLTGQLYIELDFYPDKPLTLRSMPPNPRELPTIPSPVQELTAKLEEVDIERLVNDVYAIAASLRGLLASPELRSAVKNIDSSLTNLNSLSAKLDKSVDPVVGRIDETLKEISNSMQATREAMESFDKTAASFNKMADPDSPLLASFRQTSAEFARTAAALQTLTSQDSPSIVNLNRTLKDLSTAARALRDMADSLERQPESLLKGRKNEPARP